MGFGSWRCGWVSAGVCSWRIPFFMILFIGIFLLEFDREPLIPTMSPHPDVWSDGIRVTHEVAKFESASSSVFARLSGGAWVQREW